VIDGPDGSTLRWPLAGVAHALSTGALPFYERSASIATAAPVRAPRFARFGSLGRMLGVNVRSSRTRKAGGLSIDAGRGSVLFAEESHTVGPDVSCVCLVQRELGVRLEPASGPVGAYRNSRQVWFVSALPSGPKGTILKREIMLLSEPADAAAGGWS